MVFQKQPSQSLFVDQAQNDFGVVIRSEFPDGFMQGAVGALVLHDKWLKGWTSDTVAVNHDQLWQLSIVNLSEVLEGLSHKVSEPFASITTDEGVLLVFCQILIIPVQVLQ